MKEETKRKIFIVSAGLATMYGICGAAGIGYSFIYGPRTIIASIPFWILSGMFYLVAYVYMKKPCKPIVGEER